MDDRAELLAVDAHDVDVHVGLGEVPLERGVVAGGAGQHHPADDHDVCPIHLLEQSARALHEAALEGGLLCNGRRRCGRARRAHHLPVTVGEVSELEALEVVPTGDEVHVAGQRRRTAPPVKVREPTLHTAHGAAQHGAVNARGSRPCQQRQHAILVQLQALHQERCGRRAQPLRFRHALQRAPELGRCQLLQRWDLAGQQLCEAPAAQASCEVKRCQAGPVNTSFHELSESIPELLCLSLRRLFVAGKDSETQPHPMVLVGWRLLAVQLRKTQDQREPGCLSACHGQRRLH
mmetsp:Transcript_20778/g.62565  ORF Transcript_20778/g.62565 Transcript_20778/m.62565 type:complete len:292 (-) Transcript_20778:63-938(-)